jgi:hypothetical protein
LVLQFPAEPAGLFGKSQLILPILRQCAGYGLRSAECDADRRCLAFEHRFRALAVRLHGNERLGDFHPFEPPVRRSAGSNILVPADMVLRAFLTIYIGRNKWKIKGKF